MSVKLKLARIAAKAELAVERVFRRPTEARMIDPYVGYATPEQIILRGRVLANVDSTAAREGQSRLQNVRQMIHLFATDEVADVEVTALGVAARTDEEGYFTLLLPRDALTESGDVTVTTGQVSAACPVILPRADAAFAVASDIDDTMMRTGAYSLAKNVWTSLTGNDLTRHVFPDAVQLMDLLRDGGRNPVYFVSSSPWNFHGFLQRVFARNGLPKAPMFLRDYGISETQLITGTHGDHKGAAIDALMAAHPNLQYVLIGDTGQHDAHVYADAAERHPGRVARVVLRAPGKGVDATDANWIGRLESLGVTVHVGVDYTEALAALAPWVAAQRKVNGQAAE